MKTYTPYGLWFVPYSIIMVRYIRSYYIMLKISYHIDIYNLLRSTTIYDDSSATFEHADIGKFVPKSTLSSSLDTNQRRASEVRLDLIL